MPMKARYTVIDGEVVAEKRGGVRRQYVPDPLGSTVALLDNTQTKTDTFSYWPYGEEAARTGTTATPFRYVGTMGYYRDSTTKSYVRARYLATNIGRWLTKDLHVDNSEFNLYRYVYNNTINLIDPSGRAAIWHMPSPLPFPLSLFYPFEHATITFEFITCNVGGTPTRGIGFWPNTDWGPFMPYAPGFIDPSDPHAGEGKRISRNPSADFERALCKCIQDSYNSPPPYIFPVSQCDTWANDMWTCAKNSPLYKHSKPFAPPSVWDYIKDTLRYMMPT